MPTLPTTTLYTPSVYQKLFVKLDNRLQTEVQSVSMHRTDGGATVTTTVKGWAGVAVGAPMCTGVIKGVIPYVLTDASGGGGVGFSSAGIVTGKGIQLDQTMLSNSNTNLDLPISIIISIGQPAAQQIAILGFIRTLDIDYADGKIADFTANYEGQFSTFQ